ncbi:cobaltochelatase subunit CobN [Bacteroides sp.]|uniref:cobaltochelatase subunit CobN n=1 Tax=Bacteroides sp. TaxID=29523 RepID=UPI00262E9019|nr:cobaltochelatase subunit CobN [Bacteroides sp.]
MNKRRLGLLLGSAVLVIAAYFATYRYWLAPTRILIVNPLPAQAADIALNNDSKHIEVTCIKMEEVKDLSGYDAIMMYGRGLFLDETQIAEMERVAAQGVPIFTNALRNFNFIANYNITPEQQATLQTYFQNACKKNYRNALRYLRHLSTPLRRGDQEFEVPVELPNNLYYHQEYGQYFNTHEELTAYLKQKHLYHENARTLAFISGISFPMEGNRAHVDTLISRLTQAGFNVYPITGSGKGREDMIHSLHPDAMVYLPMGRLGNDSLIQWLHDENIPLFMPFPLVQPREEWLDVTKPVSGGTLTARVVVPEIDGGMAPLCIATQNENKEGYFLHTPEPERIDAFIDHITRYMALRNQANKDKHIAICYFKTPGKDALLASGMEVIPSLYNFLKRLRNEGYNVSGLPATVEEFGKQIHRDGAVMGSYAKGAQEQFLKTAHPVWLTTRQYEQWAHEIILPEKHKEVTDRYGDAPGNLLATKDSIAIACLQFGNILLFPQPRPALGDDDFKLVHGMPVAPPHSYLAPYLYMQKGFKADALIHFGTHGNLEYTPGKNVGQSRADWSDALVGNLPHFYYYTTGNVGEGIIAKRRTHAVLVTHLTPPYVESGMRQRYTSLLEDIHKILDEGTEGHRMLGMRIKKEAVRLGLHRDLGLDSIPDNPYTAEELEQLDAFTEEIANEKMIGAYYTMGEPYSNRDLLTTTLAVAADPLAYETAKRDRDKGKITTEQLQDFTYITHHYLPSAKKRLTALLQNPPKDTAGIAAELRPALLYRRQLAASTANEFNAMVRALNGGTVYPAPGGDPVLNPNVLPTGRNMYSVNAETTPNSRAWEDGKRLAETTLKQYLSKHGEYPRKVSYTFWAGEFITTEGATLAQVFWMLGVEPVRDGQDRVVDLKLVSGKELGRPRINVVVQVSGQLRDIAGSRLKLLTDAVRLASEAKDDAYPNYVSSGTLLQEKLLVEKGTSPKRAREMSVMRIFGPVNSGYSTGIMGYTESSGSWDDEKEIAQGYLNNMGAAYGDEENWGSYQKDLFASALSETDVVIQPRQSNTWGPISLDHVYEFTGGMSLTVKTLTGKEPDAYMADYRNRTNRRMQDAKEAIAVETRATILNPTFIQERMKGGAGTAQMFGEIFRNIFGWHVMRPSAMDKELFNDLYKMYILDENQLGIHDYFREVNPASFQAMTAVMLESARKGYWKASEEQLKTTAALHAQITREKGAACTEFVCGNAKLQNFVAEQLDNNTRQTYSQDMKAIHETSADNGKDVVLKEQKLTPEQETHKNTMNGLVIGMVVMVAFIGLVVLLKKRKKQ